MIALALAIAAGVPIALLLDARIRGTLLAGSAVLLGLGFCSFVLFALSIAGVPWSRGVVSAVVLGGAAIALVAILRRRGGGASTERPHWLDLGTIAGLVGYSLFSIVAPIWDFDYLVNWGLKARVFWENGGIDWPFLESAWYRAVHPDYPLLLPLAFDYISVIDGVWNGRPFGLLNVLFAAALLLIVRRVAWEETGSPWMAALLALAMLPFAATPWVGIGEGPFVAYGTAAILLLRDDSRATTAAIFLGLAASTKNEGLTLIVAVAVALLLVRRRRTVLRLWPAIVIPLPWLIARAMHDLPTDHFSGSVLSRVMAHLGDPMPMLEALARHSAGKPVYWLGIVVAAIVVRRTLTTADRFALGAVALQFAFYIGAYLTSPHDLDWHIRWSWERLVSHVTPTLTAVLLLALARRWQTVATPAPAEP